MSSDLADLSVEPAHDGHVKQFISMWVPYHIYRLATDSTWTYGIFKWEHIIPYQGFNSLAAVSEDGTLEGLLATEVQDTYFKIAFLATAPWNFGPNKKLQGVGSGLLSLAVAASVELGFGGEVYLSSTPESETFYERLRFVRTGQRDDEDLAIFRLPAERASGLMQRYPPIGQTRERAV